MNYKLCLNTYLKRRDNLKEGYSQQIPFGSHF